ncbi:MAG: hypothetical protein ACLFVU_14185 [Phycisphaerae bacterium]
MPRRYWKFYWPLGLMGILMLLGKQFQNGVLARYPDAVRELANFSFAASVFWFFHSGIVFIPQMANVLGRCRHSRRLVLKFAAVACVGLTVPVLFLAYTDPGRDVISAIFSVTGSSLDDVVLYLRLLSPLILINGVKDYSVGLLVQAHRTKLVTVTNILQMAAGLATLLLLLWMDVSAVYTMSISMLVGAGVHFLLTIAACGRLYDGPEETDRPTLTWADALRFFWPVATTSAMFALSRPIIYAYANRLADGEESVAALRVGFDFALIFHNPINQFRHFFVTFGDEDRDGVRRFMTLVMFVLFGMMLLIAVTPISLLIFTGLMGVDAEIAGMAREALLVLSVFPLVVTLRNFYHGDLMIRKRTFGMAAGAVLRVAAIWISSLLLYWTGWLDHVVAATILLLGFMVEAVTVTLFARKVNGIDNSSGTCEAPAD